MAPIELVREEDLEDLLRLMRAYCDFYGVSPADEALLGCLARSSPTQTARGSS